MSDLGDYTRCEFLDVFKEQYEIFALSAAPDSDRHPKAVLLGGQSGVGKTSLHLHFKRFLPKGTAIIDGDTFRPLHPRYGQIFAEYGVDAPKHTAKWAGEMTEALIDELSQVGVNLIVDGALRTLETPKRTAELLISRGYEVSLAVMAVKAEISSASCDYRYEKMRETGMLPRAVDPEHHKANVASIAGNLAVLEESGLLKETLLFNRFGEQIYPREGFEGSASEALCEVLEGPWDDRETRHLAFLREQLNRIG